MSGSGNQQQGSSLKDNSLKIAGWSYIMGDVAMFAAGYARKDPATLWGSASWLLGGIGAGVFGNPKTERQLQIQASKLEQYLKQKGVLIPDDARSRSELLKKKSLWGHVEQFCYEHPSEILNAGYAVGAGMLLRDGIKELGSGRAALFPKRFAFNHGMSSNFWIGVLVLCGALIGLLTKEDPKAREANKDNDKNQGFFSRTIAFVKEKPLRVSAGLYMANNAFLLTKAFEDFSKRKGLYAGTGLKPHHFSFTQLALYLFANSMLMISNRDQISDKGFKPEDIAKLEHAAACIIAAQPPEAQRAMLNDVSNYLAREKGINIDPATLATHLAAKVGEVTHTRLQETANTMKWTERTMPQADTAPVLGK